MLLWCRVNLSQHIHATYALRRLAAPASQFFPCAVGRMFRVRFVPLGLWASTYGSVLIFFYLFSLILATRSVALLD